MGTLEDTDATIPVANEDRVPVSKVRDFIGDIKEITDGPYTDIHQAMWEIDNRVAEFREEIQRYE